MYIMTKEGDILYFDITKFNSDNEMYQTLWKISYGINLPKENENILDSIVEYVNGEKKFI